MLEVPRKVDFLVADARNGLQRFSNIHRHRCTDRIQLLLATRDDAAADGAAEAGSAAAIGPVAVAFDNNSRRVIDVFAWRFPFNLI